MKKLLSPMCSSIPNLIEYISSESEESEIDSMQARKCCDFKRMMLESVKEGEGVGIPVPIGYDDIQVRSFRVFAKLIVTLCIGY